MNGQGLEANVEQPRQASPWSRLEIVAAWVVLLTLALGLRIGLAIHFPNTFHPDEVFQTLEPAHRLAYGYGVVTWEWREGIRSWVFPAFLAGVMRATGWMSSGSSGYIDGIIVVLSLASLSNVWFGYAWAKRVCGSEAAAIAAVACALYFELIYFGPKALTEVAATNFLLPGLYLGAFAGQKRERTRLFAAGILCGIAASLRIQLIPAIAFAAVYFCYPHWRRRIPAVAAGLSIPVLVFGLVDKFTWSYPWQSFIRNFQVNVLEGRSKIYGVEPWYWYLPLVLTLIGPVIFFVVQGAVRSPFLAAVALIILGSHSVLAHKEVRFMYPLLPMVLTLAAIGFVEMVKWAKPGVPRPGFSKKLLVSGVIFFVLSSGFETLMLSHWLKVDSPKLLNDQLSSDTSLCGIGFYVTDWIGVLGYSHLHRDVPMVTIRSGDDLARQAPTFNVLVVADKPEVNHSGFERAACLRGVCVYRRAGACQAPLPEDTINPYLQATGR